MNIWLTWVILNDIFDLVYTIMLCGSVRNIFMIDVILVLKKQFIMVLFLEESVIIKGFTVQQLTIVHEKPLPMDMIPFYRVDVLL